MVDTGQRTPGGRGRGRVGSYYALADDIGVALAVSIAPEGIVAECVDAYGDTVSRADRAIDRPARPDDVDAALRTAAADARHGAGLIPRLAVVSAADPVDRHTGKLIHLPDAPFLLGELDPVEVLAPHVDGPVTVDNDVNWAARAERDMRHGARPAWTTSPTSSWARDWAARSSAMARSGAGTAASPARLRTSSPSARTAGRLVSSRYSASSACGRPIRRPSTPAGSWPRRPARDPQAATTRHALGQAISGVLAAVVALADPELIIIGGSWGSHPVILDTISTATARLPRHAHPSGPPS